MELYIRRQILHGDITRAFQKIVLVPHHLLDHCEKPDILEDLRLRLRLPDAPSLNDGNTDDVRSSVEAPPPRMIIAFFREDSTSYAVLAVTTLPHNCCNTLFIFCHFVVKQTMETLVSRMTSVFNHAFKDSGICIRSVTARLPKLERPQKASSGVI